MPRPEETLSGWQEADLAWRRKRDLRKLKIEVRLRKQTTLSVKDTAARLHLPGSASNLFAPGHEQGTTRQPYPRPP